MNTDEPSVLLADLQWLRRLARSLLAGDGDDAVQDTYVAALTAAPARDRPLRAWLAHVLRNFARMRHRGRMRSQRFERTLAADVPTVPGADDLIAQHEARRLVADAVSALEEPLRSTVLLRYSEGLTPAEIASRLGIPGGTVRSRLKRGLDEIRSRLDARHAGERGTWRTLLIPIADSRPSRTGLWTVALTAAACTVIGLTTTLALQVWSPTGQAPRRLDDATAARRSVADSPSLRTPAPSKGDPMNPSHTVSTHNHKRTVAIAVAALAAAAASANADDQAELPRAQAIAECVSINEKRQSCVDEYAAQAVEQNLAIRKKTASADERKAMEAKVVEQATREGSGPMEVREKQCSKMIDYLGKRGVKPTPGPVRAIHACFQASDCKARISCYLAESAKLLPPPKP